MLLAVSNRNTNSALRSTFSPKTVCLDGSHGHLVLVWRFSDNIKNRRFFQSFSFALLHVSAFFVFLLPVLSVLEG